MRTRRLRPMADDIEGLAQSLATDLSHYQEIRHRETVAAIRSRWRLLADLRARAP
jgi:hypothetical protein